MVVDKQLTVIIIFLALMFTIAGILVMGAVPKIFENADISNQTQGILNQTQIQLHEDASRNNQTLFEMRHEEKGRTIQTAHNDMQLQKLADKLMGFINASTERSEIGQQERQAILGNVLELQTEVKNLTKSIESNTEQILNLTQNDYSGATAHREMSTMHHDKILELMDGLDQNLNQNFTELKQIK